MDFIRETIEESRRRVVGTRRAGDAMSILKRESVPFDNFLVNEGNKAIEGQRDVG